MRVVVQKVKNASVKVNNQLVGKINNGLMVLAGYEPSDSKEDISWMVQKIIKMRIFDDSENKLNFSLLEVNGEILLISQFTLHASVKKGNRPSYIKAALIIQWVVEKENHQGIHDWRGANILP